MVDGQPKIVERRIADEDGDEWLVGEPWEVDGEVCQGQFTVTVESPRQRRGNWKGTTVRFPGSTVTADGAARYAAVLTRAAELAGRLDKEARA